MAKKAADLITEVLHRAGVRRIYGIVGDSLNAITEALRERGDIDWMCAMRRLRPLPPGPRRR